MAVGSSLCGTLSEPYVSVSFTVHESDGKEVSHAMEMTLSEFQVWLCYILVYSLGCIHSVGKGECKLMFARR